MAKKAQPSPASTAGHRPVIPQELLREYRELAAEAKSIRRKLKRLRDELLAQMRAGADVEPGDLTIQAKLFVQKREDHGSTFLSPKAAQQGVSYRANADEDAGVDSILNLDPTCD